MQTLALSNGSDVTSLRNDENVTTLDSYRVNETVEAAYIIVSGTMAFVQFYILASLLLYEMFVPEKPKTGRKLRVLCVLAVATSLAHECLQPLIVTVSGIDDVACFILMSSKSTVYNAVITSTYGFFWLRQRMFYSTKTLQHLRGKTMTVITWVVLLLLFVNPCIMLGFQFKGRLYQAKDGVCLVLRQPIIDQLPFIAVAFSYAFIQVTLIFLYFYPLYKRNIPLKCPRNPSTSLTPMPNSQGVIIFSDHPDTSAHELQNGNVFTAKSQTNRLQRRMKRWLALGAICVLSDAISATIIAVFLLQITPASLVSVMFLWHDVSMLISVLCTVGCFNEYKVMLFPFKVIYNCHRK